MPTPEVIAVADQVSAHLDQGDLAGLGPVDLGPSGGIHPDAELAARVVLADVGHCVWREQQDADSVPAEEWAELAEQLRRVLRVLVPDHEGEARRRGRGDGG